MVKPQQLSFALPPSTAYDVNDFMVSVACNAAAFDAVWRWPEWDQPLLVIYGPAASGKTHLAHVWAARSHAKFLDPHTLHTETVEQLIAQNRASECWVVDGLTHVPDEAALFHLLNAIREQGGCLLIMSAVAPSECDFALADVRSRLAAAPTQALHAPDDAVLKAVIIKQFADRQLRVGDDVLSYLLTRMDRSFASARAWVERLDAKALQDKRKVTVAMVRELLDAMDAEYQQTFL